jgi:hypothetical protein
MEMAKSICQGLAWRPTKSGMRNDAYPGMKTRDERKDENARPAIPYSIKAAAIAPKNINYI